MQRNRFPFIAALIPALFLPATVRAQSEPVAMHERALSMQASGSNLTAVADLHIRSARLRPATDPQVQRCLYTAGHLYYYAGDLRKAFDLMVEASDVALSRGDAVWAANAFLLAAQIAVDDGRMADARAMVQRAEVLAHGPAFNVVQRAAILDRIVRRGQIVVAVR